MQNIDVVRRIIECVNARLPEAERLPAADRIHRHRPPGIRPPTPSTAADRKRTRLAAAGDLRERIEKTVNWYFDNDL
ncbi:MAG: hypothetical protein R3F11_12575 [Verrucomicrobiales bacterium]